MLERRTLLLGSAGLLGLGLLAVTGCTPDADDEQEAPPTTPGPDPIDETLPDLTLTRAFGQEVTPTTAFYSMGLAAGHVLLYDDTDTIEGRLLVLDGATGESRWSWPQVEARIPDIDARASAYAPSTFAVGGSGDEAVLVASTYVNPCPEDAAICSTSQTDLTSGHGIVAVGVASGDVRWHALVLPPVDRSDPASTLANDSTVEPVGGTDAVVVARVGQSEFVIVPTTAPARDDRVRTVALSAVDGTVVWERPGLVATLVDADVVAGMLHTDVGVVLVLVDAATGDDLWSMEPGQTLGGIAAGAVVVQTESAAWLADARTGEVLVEPQSEGSTIVSRITIGTDADGGPLVAWGARDDRQDGQSGDPAYRLWTADADGAGASVEDVGDWLSPSDVRDGYVWCSDNTALQALDRSGATRSDPVDGYVRGLADGLLLMQTDGGFDLYAVA